MVSTRSRNDSSETDDKDQQQQQQPKSKKQKTTTTSSANADTSKTDSIGGITLEYAKSGRSTCRNCQKAIDKDTPRVGMETWISGRLSTTWQHIDCFLGDNIEVGYDKSGRSKCSVTGKTIEKGSIKIDLHSHTATRRVMLEQVDRVLKAVLAWVPSDKKEDVKKLLQLKNIKGVDEFNEDDKEKVQQMLDSPNEPVSSSSKRGSIADQEDQAKDKEDKVQNNNNNEKDQPSDGQLDSDGKPKSGTVAHQEGEVEWEFAGGTYEGDLLPNKETEDKAYARTKNGNVKTLHKDYWSMAQ